MASRRLLNQRSSMLFVCDIQERFRPVIYKSENLIKNSRFLYHATQILQVPCVVTEHYKKAFGSTIADLGIVPGDQTKIYEKTKFSMLQEEVSNAIAKPQTVFPTCSSALQQDIILCGIEAHVCVLQTALELIERGFYVHVACDAVSSQRSYDREIALQRLKDAGAALTTTESIVFQLMRDATHPNFKAVSKMIKDHNAEMGGLELTWNEK